MELNRVIWHFEALHRELEQLREVALEKCITGFREISHLEGILDFQQDRDEFLVELAVFHDEGRAGR